MRGARVRPKRYQRPLWRAGRTVEHAIAVARLLIADRQPSKVVIAGLLHDLLEDTDTTASELEAAFGPHIAELVRALTQDSSFGNIERTAALRQHIVDAGPETAVVSLADKAAKLRNAGARPEQHTLDHYRPTLVAIERRYRSSSLSASLREQLDRWREG